MQATEINKLHAVDYSLIHRLHWLIVFIVTSYTSSSLRLRHFLTKKTYVT